MNLQDIIDEINKDTDEDLENDEVLGWINRCLDDLTPLARYQKTMTITTKNGVNTYSLPSDLTKIVQVIDESNSLSPLDMSEYNKNGYKVFANQLILQPTPDSVRDITLYYEGNLPHLVNGEDIPAIHPSFHDLPVLYTVARFMYKDDETYRKSDALAEYTQRKRDFVRFMNRSFISPIRNVYGRWY